MKKQIWGKTASQIVHETTKDYGQTSSKWKPEERFLSGKECKQLADKLEKAGELFNEVESKSGISKESWTCWSMINDVVVVLRSIEVEEKEKIFQIINLVEQDFDASVKHIEGMNHEKFKSHTKGDDLPAL